MCKLLLRQIIQCIGLILRRRHRIANAVSSIWELRDTRIVTGCDIIRANLQRTLQQRLPLHVAVAGNTRIRRASILVFIHKVINDRLLEIRFKIHNIIWDFQPIRHATGIIHRRQSAASTLSRLCEYVLVLPDLHRDSDNIISLLLEEICRHR